MRNYDRSDVALLETEAYAFHKLVNQMECPYYTILAMRKALHHTILNEILGEIEKLWIFTLAIADDTVNLGCTYQ